MSLALFDLVDNQEYETLLQQFNHKPSTLNEQHPDGYSIIHLLVQMAPLSIVREVVRLGANIHKQDNFGETPFCWALNNSNFDVAEFLFSQGAKVNIQNSDGLSPIHVAATERNLKAIAFLIEHGVHINQESREKATPLHYATLSGNKELVEYILGLNANVDAQDNNGDTPLDWALSVNTINQQTHAQKALIVESLAQSKVNKKTKGEFACTLMHPRLFPGVFLDLFNPPKIKIMARIEIDRLSFFSTTPNSDGQLKKLGDDSFAYIEHVTIQNVSAREQRIEILEKGLSRRFPVAAVGFFIFMLFQSSSIKVSILVALATGIISAMLYFLLNGGLTAKHDVTRFLFTPLKPHKLFYLEVRSEDEANLHQVLRSTSLMSDREKHSNHDVWECDKCGGVVNASATKCSNCGIEFEE